MAKQVKLKVQSRSGVGRSAVKKIKAQGLVPATLYGAKTQPQNLQVSAREISQLLAHAVGENILVDLAIEDNGSVTSRAALIKDVQHQAIGGAVLHVDFNEVDMNKAIRATIPVEPVGEAIGLKAGGILEQSLRALHLECLPKDLPETITVDVSNLKVGDAIHVKDLQLPAGVVALDEAELTVLHVAEPTVQEPTPAEAAAAAAAAPEVIKEKKPEGAEAKK
jgi:large subunit ribosomal protein L25